MAEAGPALSEATMALLNARTEEQYNEWKANATAEQKAKMAENQGKMKNDEEFRNGIMAKVTKAWGDADSNGDGKLDLAEFTAFEGAMRAVREADGEWFETDHAAANYAIMNSVSEGDGFTMAEMWACLKAWRAKFDAMREADGL